MRVFSTSRSLRNYYKQSLITDQFIDKAITISELLSKIVLVPNRSFIDYETRLLLLSKASEFENFTKLQIQRDLFSFIHNSQYIFSFFKELSGEGVDIKDIDAADTYAEYEEHLDILIKLKENYKALLDEKMLIDPIFLPQLAILNEPFIKSLDNLYINLEGYLTEYELNLLLTASRIISIKIKFFANTYNEKMLLQFEKLGFEVQVGFSYVLDLSLGVISSKSSYNEKIEAKVTSFSERILQVGFVKREISKYILQKGIKAKDIVVILPTESFAQTLALYDDENLFNFAMGLPFSQSLFVKRIEAITSYFDNPTKEQLYRKNRFIRNIEFIFNLMQLHYKKIVSINIFENIIQAFYIDIDQESIQIIDKELFYFKKLASFLKNCTLKIMLQLFMQRVCNVTFDDVKGGQVTVMGLLETRGVNFKAVIVVDFNDEYVPKKSQKDLFLSSSVKKIVKLPTSKDRQSLQKYFYQRIFEQASFVSISYVSSSTQMPSRFLTQLGIFKRTIIEDEAKFALILYKKYIKKEFENKVIKADYDFTKQPLSATSLKVFLQCRRKFYYQYIKKLKAHEIPLDMPKESEIGIWLHDLLQAVYTKNKKFTCVSALRKDIEIAFKEYKYKGEMERFLVQLWLKKLTPFYEIEIKRFKKGYEVFSCEKSLQIIYKEIPITGTIDRLDIINETLEVIDYKSGKINLIKDKKQLEKATEFQLQFYILLATTLGKVSNAFYYDLRNAKLIKEVMHKEKLEKLDTIFAYLTSKTNFTFDMTEDKSLCRFCDYTYLCKRRN